MLPSPLPAMNNTLVSSSKNGIMTPDAWSSSCMCTGLDKSSGFQILNSRFDCLVKPHVRTRFHVPSHVILKHLMPSWGLQGRNKGGGKDGHTWRTETGSQTGTQRAAYWHSASTAPVRGFHTRSILSLDDDAMREPS